MIRLAREEDKNAIYLLAKSFATSYQVQEDDFGHTWNTLRGRSDACLHVAETEGRVIGYLLGFVHPVFYANGPVGWVEELVVDEKERRQGTGRALMEHFEAWAKGCGCPQIALATRRAANFYRAIGYEESAAYFKKVFQYEQ